MNEELFLDADRTKELWSATKNLVGSFGGGVKKIKVVLSVSDWMDGTQTVSVIGVSADEDAQLIQPVPNVASQEVYIEAGILCTDQAENSLTFTANTLPTKDLNVYVIIQEVPS